ncbi:MAG: hypothetical protein DMG88_12410 [Acidobacteria bacterium]|nr:MAG: hypothetical protein DMG88_12410 [Acidobacteriota bacterium]
MLEKIMAACSVAIVLIGLSLYSLAGHAQSEQMARHEPHMSAAYGHLQQARAELDKASPKSDRSNSRLRTVTAKVSR